jgi:hypothetical protein
MLDHGELDQEGMIEKDAYGDPDQEVVTIKDARGDLDQEFTLIFILFCLFCNGLFTG